MTCAASDDKHALPYPANRYVYCLAYDHRARVFGLITQEIYDTTSGCGHDLLNHLGWLFVAGIWASHVLPLGCARAADDPCLTVGQGLAGVATLDYGGIMLGLAIISFVTEKSGIAIAFGLLLICTMH